MLKTYHTTLAAGLASARRKSSLWLGNRTTEPAGLRLHTKFLLSLVLVIAALTSSTLLIVGHTAKEQIQKAVEKDTRNSVLTFQNMRAERQLELNRQAEMFASLPTVKSLVSDEDSADVQTDSEEVWSLGDADLFALFDWTGKAVALHATLPGFSRDAAEQMFSHSQGIGNSGGWWFGNGSLYQTAVSAIDLGSSTENKHIGTIIVGREIDSKMAHDLARIAFCQVAFRYGNEPVVSSLPALDEQLISDRLSRAPLSGKIEIENKSYLVSTVELAPGMQPPLTLTILKSDNEASAFISRLDHNLLLFGLCAIFLGGVIVFLISRTFTRPLEQLVQGARALEQGNYAYPLGPDTGDEVSQVTAAFERMRSTLRHNQEQQRQLGEQLRQAQKMEAVGRLAGGVAHDFNNLLTVITGHSDLLEMKLGTLHPSQNSVAQVKKAAQRATALTRQLLAFSRMQVLRPRVLDLNSLIADLNKMLPMLMGEEIEYSFFPGAQLANVKADPSQIEQVLMNLAVNARDAMSKGGSLTIKTQNVLIDEKYARSHPPSIPGEYVLVVVADTGHGMDEQTKAKIFEPFFTTKEIGRGTGLGLATVYGIVKQSRGYIWVDSTPGRGTRFEILLPQSSEVEPSALQDEPCAAAKPGSGTVLLAEDEEAVRELASEFLRTSGYQVIVAKDGLEALDLANRRSQPIDILLTDVVMPRMRGTELALRLKRVYPTLKIVYMSGYLEHSSESEFIENAEQLQKPFSRESLLQTLRTSLDRKTSSALQST